jgi:hypothetical protein
MASYDVEEELYEAACAEGDADAAERYARLLRGRGDEVAAEVWYTLAAYRRLFAPGEGARP